VPASGVLSGTHIPCILIPYRDADALIVFAHGNGCDIGSMYETLQYYKNHWKVNVLMFDYPGYGACPGVPSEASINAATLSVFCFIRDTLKWPLDRLVLFGQSIGTGPVCHLAANLNRAHQHLAGIILQSPYTCLPDVVKFLAGRAGTIASKLISTGWSNQTEVQSIIDPILIIHGEMEEKVCITGLTRMSS
jgi:pimeloyl-ACP methyl ester carboxylesterase